jgi:hypothetical protein
LTGSSPWPSSTRSGPANRLHRYRRGRAVPGRGDRPVQPPSGGLVAAPGHDRTQHNTTSDIVIDALRMAWFKRHPSKSGGLTSKAKGAASTRKGLASARCNSKKTGWPINPGKPARSPARGYGIQGPGQPRQSVFSFSATWPEALMRTRFLTSTGRSSALWRTTACRLTSSMSAHNARLKAVPGGTAA